MSSLRILKSKIFNNIGLVNLIGKVVGKGMFLGVLAFLAYKMPTTEFANFAIFWSTLRLYAFYGGNNLYIVFFDKVRTSLLSHSVWPRAISSNIILTFAFFLIPFTLIASIIFQNATITLLIILSSALLLLIRYIAEFSKVDNNIFLSIFLEDILFNILLFLTYLVVTFYELSFLNIIVATFIALCISVIIGLWLFIRKFKLRINTWFISVHDFSKSAFKTGFNYSLLRGQEVLSNFSIKYLGAIYYGSIFVAYTHVIYQFYNIFTMISVSVISGFQSKITLKSSKVLSIGNIKSSYMMIGKSLLPFTALLLLVFVFGGKLILGALFPKYVEYYYLLMAIGLPGLLYSLVQPFIFILVYNNQYPNIHLANRIQYFFLATLLLIPLIGINQDIWFLLFLSLFTLIQGVLGFLVIKVRANSN